MKKAIALILALVLCAGLFTGCAGDKSTPEVSSSPTTAAAATDSGAKATNDLNGVEVTFWYMPLYDGFDKLMSETLAKEVKDAYGIILNTEVLTWDAGPEKVTVAMATDSTPDLYLDTYSRIAPALVGNLSADISDTEKSLASGFYDGVTDIGTVNDQVEYLPVSLSTGYNICVNTSLVKQLGIYDMLPTDKIHWSYDEFLAFCRACREKGKDQDIYATQLFAGSKSSDAVYYSFLMSGGTSILKSDYSSVTANTAPAAKTLGLFKTMIDEDLVPAGAATTVDNDIRPNWYSQKLAFMLVSTGIGEVTKVKQQIDSGEIKPFDVDIYEIPTPDGKADPHVVSWGSTGFTVFKNSGDEKKIEAAKRVIETFFKNPAYSQEMCVHTGNSTVLKDLTVDYGDETINKLAQRAAVSTASYADDSIGILKPWWGDFRETFYVELQAYYTGEKTAEQALNDWATSGNTVLANAAAS